MTSQIAGSKGMLRPVATRQLMVRRILLACGILASVLYVVANDVIAAGLYPGYSRISQPISQLSATFAPSRPFLVPLIVIYLVLCIAFGVGVRQSAQGKRTLRVTGGLIIVGAALGLVALAFPMTRPDLSDTIHNLLMGTVTPLLMFATIGFGAAALGKGFRLYSIVTLAVLLLGGVLSAMQVAQIAAGESVPWFGITQRLLTGAWLLWVAVLSIVLLRAQREKTES